MATRSQRRSRLLHVVRRQQHRAALDAEALHDVPQLQPALRIEAGGRLVEEEHVRIADQRARDAEPLLLAAREFADARVALLIERQIAQQLLGVVPVAIERAEEAHGLEDGELLGELRFLQRDADALAQLALVLAPVQAEDLDLAGVGLGQPFEDLDGRRLAGAVRPEQAEAFAAGDGRDRARRPPSRRRSTCADCGRR